MKRAVMTIALIWPFLAAHAEDCSNLAGIYVARCPSHAETYAAEVYRQVDCAAISTQKITFDQNDQPISFSKPVWQPIGLGKMLVGEDAATARYEEWFFQNNALYTYYYTQDKQTGLFHFDRADVKAKLKNGNFLRTSGQRSETLFSLPSCP